MGFDASTKRLEVITNLLKRFLFWIPESEIHGVSDFK